MKTTARLIIIASLALVLLLAGLSAGVLLDRVVMNHLTQPAAASTELQDQLPLLNQAWQLINQRYVDQSAVNGDRLAHGAIAGMVDSLGDTGHSRFLSPEMVQDQHELTQGEFQGIGAEVQMKDDHVVIVAPIDGSPAQKAGLQPGDLILRVAGQDIAGLPLEEVVKRIVGPAGSQVTLTILTPASGQTRDVTLTRAHIPIHSVDWAPLPGANVAHLRITAFSKGVTDDLKQALTDIQAQGYSGVVLDLRNNPGGLLDEAIGVASQFLTGGNVLQQEDAQGHVRDIPVRSGGIAPDLPVVVLVNPGTASASEIVAGALQDAGRATVVGETTFGTGTVLNQFNLSDGSALLLATEQWLTPKGRVIWHHGITPDVTSSLEAGATMLYPGAERDMSAEQLQSSTDSQLLQALQLLAAHQPSASSD
ncbi:MAG: S41 family peptidase [Caldilineales bacterium]